MARTLKARLTRGLGGLFVIVLLLSGVGIYFLLKLSHSAEAVLQDNYRSVAYARQMADALADLRQAGAEPAAAGAARTTFTENLEAERHNITEPGEQALADSLAAAYGSYAAATAPSAGQYAAVRRLVDRVASLNLQAVARRAHGTQQLASRTVTALVLLAGIGVVLTLSFWFNFPDYLTRPVEELTAGIRRVAAGQYGQPLTVDPQSEFAPVARSLNELAARLSGYETPEGTLQVRSDGSLERVLPHQRPDAADPAPPASPPAGS